ncbi:hypothetical protein FKP32DRAFT_1687389 [Trametes sanguinea]|nr:hypothetical protein FKP32DRAFT_1687389 [Trametes sanguinea]
MSGDDTSVFLGGNPPLISDALLRWLDSSTLEGSHPQADANSDDPSHAGPADEDSHAIMLLDQSSVDASVGPPTIDHSLEPCSSPGDNSQDTHTNHSPSPISSATGQHAKKKARISLDPDQPLTAAGKPRARVYVACNDCRTRKIRCDGAKPVCYNCRRCAPDTVAGSYDSLPNRRGQDKIPGTRVRSAPGQRKFRQASENQIAESSAHGANSTHGVYLRWRYENLPNNHFQDPVSSFDPSNINSTQTEARQIPFPPSNAPERDVELGSRRELTPEPSSQFTRETWWDSLLVMYASEDIGQSLHAISLTADQRLMYTQRIFVDVRALFHTSVYWASFIHLPRLFEALIDPVRRSFIQPSLLLAMLAMGTFVQSSNLGLGARGRKRALKLVEQAHAALQASLSSHWVDIGLAQAAWVLAYFEIQVHPEQSWERNRSSFVLLDSLIRLFSLTTLDADVPHSHFSLFEMHKGLALAPSQALQLAQPGLPGQDIAVLPVEAVCSCAHYTLGKQWPGVLELAPLWESTVMWPPDASEGELRKEEGRRLVWSSVMLAAAHNSYTSARADVDNADLYIKHYENAYEQSLIQKSQFAVDAWLETEAIEVALNHHVCDLESRMAYQAREFLFSARMCFTLDFQRYIPYVSSNNSLPRQKAESWLRRQMAVTQYLWDCLHTNPANELGTRSFLVYWFMGHVLRALVIWENDPTMTLALDAAKFFVLPLEYLMQLWPSQNQREKWQGIRMKLVEACIEAGIPLPSPVLPPPLPQGGLCAPLKPQGSSTAAAP